LGQLAEIQGDTEGAMWGSDKWGEMVWGADGGLPIPMLDATALVVLVSVLLIGTVVVVRRADAPR
jgi:hypothetical protein